MGCIFIGVFLMPASVRRFGKKKVYIGGLLIWVLGDLPQLFPRRRFGQLQGVLLPGVLWLSVC